jgi:undecaprenyl-diphosphatase
MRSFVNSLTRWDVLFLNSIFGLDGKRMIALVMPWISRTGDGYCYPAIPIAILFFEPRKARLFLISGLLAFALELPVYRIMKQLIKRPRPCDALDNVRKRVSPGDLFSFPSGHTAAAFVIATLLSNFFPGLTIPAYLWSLAVGFSRLYLGVHYPTDVLAGMLIGILGALTALGVVS